MSGNHLHILISRLTLQVFPLVFKENPFFNWQSNYHKYFCISVDNLPFDISYLLTPEGMI